MRKVRRAGLTLARRRRSVWVLVSGVTVPLVFIAGCAHQPTPEEIHDTLSIFFDGVPRPGEKQEKEIEALRERLEALEKELAALKGRRRQPQLAPERPSPSGAPAPTAEKAAAAPDAAKPPIAELRTWNEVAKRLPQASTGGVDWVAALTQGVIAPQGGLTPEAKPRDVMDLDVELVPMVGEIFKVIFPHKVHTAWLGCENCHPGIFQMAKGADPITMEKINAGEYCGVCHGKVAFGVEACARCHVAMGGQ